MRLRLSSPMAREPADGDSGLYISVCSGDLTQWPTVHRYIRKRMSKDRAKVIEGEHLEWHLYELRDAFCDLWHGMAEPPLPPRLRPPPPPPEGQSPADQLLPPPVATSFTAAFLSPRVSIASGYRGHV